MKLINEIQAREHLPDDLTHQLLVEAIRSRASFLHGSRLSFGNVGESDYVLAHAGMLANIVHRATPYTDFEVKMNMALKGMQTFDFNEPTVYNIPASANRTSVANGVIRAMQSESWDVIYTNGLLRGGGSSVMRGHTYFTHNLGIHKTVDDGLVLLWAPVVRIDKFADFRRNNMFSGKIDWPATVTYWINEDFCAEMARELGITAIHGIWRRHHLPNLTQGSFRIEYVPNSEMNKLFYTPVRRRINSIIHLRQEAEEILLEVRNHALVENKPAIMTALDRVNRDYLGEFMNSHARVSTMSEEERDEADAEAEEEAAAQEEDEAWDDGPAQPAAEPGDFWRIAQETGNAIHQGVLGQIEENAVPFTAAPITVRDIEQLAAQLARPTNIPPPPAASPHTQGQAADFVDIAGNRFNLVWDPSLPPDEARMGYVHVQARGFGRTAHAAGNAFQQAQVLSQIAERERREAQRRADVENEERRRFMAQYPYTPEQAFGSQAEAEEEQLRQRMDQIQRSVVNNPPFSWDGIDALREEYNRLLRRLNELLAQARPDNVAQQAAEARLSEVIAAIRHLREGSTRELADLSDVVARFGSAITSEALHRIFVEDQEISRERMARELERQRPDDMVVAAAWTLMTQNEAGPIGGLNPGTPGEDPSIAAGISLEEQFRNPGGVPNEGMPVFNEAIAAEMREEDLYVAGIDPYDAAEDELEREAREIQQTIESQEHDTTSEDSSNQNPDVLGGSSALGEEETEIF